MKLLSVLAGSETEAVTFVPVAVLVNCEPHTAVETLPEGVCTIATTSYVLSTVAAFVFVMVTEPVVPLGVIAQLNAGTIFKIGVGDGRTCASDSLGMTTAEAANAAATSEPTSAFF